MTKINSSLLMFFLNEIKRKKNNNKMKNYTQILNIYVSRDKKFTRKK